MALQRAALDMSRRFFQIDYAGTVTLDCLKAGIAAQIQSGAWPLPCIIDTSAVTTLDVPFRDMDALLSHVHVLTSDLGRRGPLVVVAPDDRVFTHAQLYDVSAVGFLGFVRHVVRTRDDAHRWLDSVLANRG